MKKIILILIFIPNILFAENLVIPKVLNEIVEQNGCKQVSDFYERLETVQRPPYHLNYIGWGKKNYAVWCTNDMDKKDYLRKYTLLVKFEEENHELGKCPNKIENIKLIGGLEIIDDDSAIDWFYYLDTKKKLTSTSKISSLAIKSIFDGTGRIFACSNGRWVARGLH